MKKVLFIIIGILVFTHINAQSDNDEFGEKKYIQRISLIYPGVGGELYLGNYRTLSVDFFANFSPFRSEQRFSDDYAWEYRPAINLTLDYRHFIKTDSRMNRNKRIDKFSGAYGSFTVGVGLASLEKRSWYISMGPTLGFQRAIGKRFYWNVNLGVGPVIQYQLVTFTWLGSVEFGLAF